MRAHQQSSTRKFNRHWQSGGGGGRKVISFYMHANYPNSAGTPGSLNSNILINNPAPGNIINIEIDRSRRSSGYQERLDHLSDERSERMFSLWGTFRGAIDWDNGNQPAFTSTYYGHDEDWLYKGLYLYEAQYKLINLFAGAFYGVTEQDNKVHAYFNDEYTRLMMYGPIYLPRTQNQGSGAQYWDEATWIKFASLYNKVHIWIPYPRTDEILLQPSSKTESGRIYNPDGSLGPLVTFNSFPGVFQVEPTNNSGEYESYMINHPLNLHIHLPIGFPPSRTGTAPPYVRKYTYLSDADRYTWSVAPMMGMYSNKIFIKGPYPVGTNPPTTSEWYDKEFMEYMPVGDVIYHYDIDTTLSVEDNARNYAATIQ